MKLCLKQKLEMKLFLNQKLEMKKTEKMKVVQLHEDTPKQFSNPTQTQKIAHYGQKK